MRYDVCIAGGGIVGLAHAYHAARKGLKVLVTERNSICQGASVRNFGLFWAIGQEAAYKAMLADSKQVWQEFFTDTNTWHKPGGSLGLAYHDDEMAVLEEYQRLHTDPSHSLLSSNEIRIVYPYLQPQGLKGGLWSGNEITINSREAMPALASWLQCKYGVDMRFGTTVIACDLPVVHTSEGRILADRLIVSSGADFELLYPQVFREAGIRKCKLQMLKATTPGFSIEPALYGATSFVHYASFAGCSSLPALAQRLQQLQPDYQTYGINLLVAQNNHGDLILGDSHEYDDPVNPFNREHIDRLILDGISRLLPSVPLHITERWHGIYAKATDRKYLVEKPEENVMIVNAVGGAGMTLSFGLARQTIDEFI